MRNPQPYRSNCPIAAPTAAHERRKPNRAFIAVQNVLATGTRSSSHKRLPLNEDRVFQQHSGYANVEFRLGEIENLPVADGSVDVILSNCVINLSPDKGNVFHEAFRVLKPGGRVAVTDILATAPVPELLRKEVELYTACAAGAALVDEVTTMLREAGFEQTHVEPKPQSREVIREFFPGRGLENYFASATIEAVKPDVA